MSILDIILGKDLDFENPRYDSEYDEIIDLKKEIRSLREENQKLQNNIRYLENSIQLPRDSDNNVIHIDDSIFLTWNRKIRKVIGIEFHKNGHIYIWCDSGGGFRVDSLNNSDKFYVIDQKVYTI